MPPLAEAEAGRPYSYPMPTHLLRQTPRALRWRCADEGYCLRDSRRTLERSACRGGRCLGIWSGVRATRLDRRGIVWGASRRAARSSASRPKGGARQHRRSADGFEGSRTGRGLTCGDGMLGRKALQKRHATVAIAMRAVNTNAPWEERERGRGRGRRRGRERVEKGGMGGEVPIIKYDRSRMTIEPRIPTCRNRARWVFDDQAGICLHQARSAVRCWAIRIKGEFHATKNRF